MRRLFFVIIIFILHSSLFTLHLGAQSASQLVKQGQQAYQKKQYSQAYKYFKRAYDMGSGEAAMEIGYLHYFGDGRKKDDGAAYRFFTEAASKGVPKANVMRGNLYYYGGPGLKKNLKKAAECYQASADLGEVGGQTWLGEMYLNGEGVEKNRDMAIYWFQKAAAQGDVGAKQMLRDLGVNANTNTNDNPNIIKTTKKTTTTTTKTTQTTKQPVPQTTKPKATVTWLSNTSAATKKNYELKAGIKSSSRIESVVVKLNGQADRGIKTVSDDGYDMTINRTFTLASGVNTIRIEVTNAGGTTVSEKKINFNSNVSTNANANVKQTRIALVVGNANYTDSNMKLANSSNDAEDVAKRLSKLGFTVVHAQNQTKQGLDTAIKMFGERAKNADVALLYYAGHGIQYKGSNYLIPVDASLPSEEYIQYNCTNASLILDVMESSGCDMKIVILDACRNNPFARSWHRSTTGGGLGSMNAPKGTFIAFSTSPGDVALDGGEGERNSPYTKALLQTLNIKGLSITDFFQEVLERVATATNERQMPWTSNSFRGKFVFNP